MGTGAIPFLIVAIELPDGESRKRKEIFSCGGHSTQIRRSHFSLCLRIPGRFAESECAEIEGNRKLLSRKRKLNSSLSRLFGPPASGERRAMTTTAARIESLLAPPDSHQSRLLATKLLAEQLPRPVIASKLVQQLALLLAREQSQHAALSAQLDSSTATTQTLLAHGRRTAQDLHERGTALQSAHEQLQARILEYRHSVVSSISQRSPQEHGAQTPTLRERLLALSERRKQLESARDWFAVLAEAERLGYATPLHPSRYC